MERVQPGPTPSDPTRQQLTTMSKGPGHGGGRGDAGRAKEIGGFQIGGMFNGGARRPTRTSFSHATRSTRSIVCVYLTRKQCA